MTAVPYEGKCDFSFKLLKLKLMLKARVVVVVCSSLLAEQYPKVLYDMLPIIWLQPGRKANINDTVCILSGVI